MIALNGVVLSQPPGNDRMPEQQLQPTMWQKNKIANQTIFPAEMDHSVAAWWATGGIEGELREHGAPGITSLTRQWFRDPAAGEAKNDPDHDPAKD
jgi:hypothetical protein